MKGQPDVNRGAMRPAGKVDDTTQRVPDIDRPPKAIADTPGFDRSTAAEEQIAEGETLQPGNPAPPGKTGGTRAGGSV